MEKYFEINDVGINIKSKMYCNNVRNVNNVVLSCHGFGGNKENNASKKLAETLLDKYEDLAVITFDWPCHGKDVRQKLNLTDCNDYLDTVINYIKNDMHVDNICFQGTSFGGYLVLKYISEHDNPFKKIALRCPAVNMYNVLTEKILTPEQLENVNKGKIENAGFERKIKIDSNLVNELRENDIMHRSYIDMADDILIMHGTEDEVVDYDIDKAFCEENVIDFITIEGADHRYRNPAKLRECITHIDNFYQGIFDAKKNK